MPNSKLQTKTVAVLPLIKKNINESNLSPTFDFIRLSLIYTCWFSFFQYQQTKNPLLIATKSIEYSFCLTQLLKNWMWIKSQNPCIFIILQRHYPILIVFKTEV